MMITARVIAVASVMVMMVMLIRTMTIIPQEPIAEEHTCYAHTMSHLPAAGDVREV